MRGVDKDKCEKVADALYLGGIRLTEVTFNQRDPSSFSVTAQAIALLSEKYKDRMLIGAGTVLTAEQVEIRTLTKGIFYFFRVDSFNTAGVTIGTVTERL